MTERDTNRETEEHGETKDNKGGANKREREIEREKERKRDIERERERLNEKERD